MMMMFALPVFLLMLSPWNVDANVTLLRGHRQEQTVATPVGRLLELRWIDANTNKRVKVQGSEIVSESPNPINAETDSFFFPNVPLTMEALTTGGPVGSVKFTFYSIATDTTTTYIENNAPYAACANVGADFLPCVGFRESGGYISAQVFAGKGATGAALSDEFVKWVRFYSGSPPIAKFAVYNADTDTEIGPDQAYMTVNVTETPRVAIVVEAFGGPYRWGPFSAKLDYDNGANVVMEYNAPYVYPGNQGSNYAGFTPTPGNHTITATLFSGTNSEGKKRSQTYTENIFVVV